MTPNSVDLAMNVVGMMLREEVAWLHKAAQEMESIVEIGSYRGRSTYVLCAGCRGMVYAVDPFVANFHQEIRDVFEDFAENLKAFENLIPVIKTSQEAAHSIIIPAMVDMVFIDADHSYRAVLEDLQLWEPRTRKLVCGHDYGGPMTPGVEEAVNEYFGSRERIKLGPGTLWAVRKAV
jgi:predicted O-methyltransferase YrrM